MQRKTRQEDTTKSSHFCKEATEGNSSKKELGFQDTFRTMKHRLSVRSFLLIFLAGLMVIRTLRPSFNEELTNDASTRAPDLIQQGLDHSALKADVNAGPAPRINIAPQASAPTSEFPHFLEEYMKFHEQTKLTSDARYLIWRCPRGSTCGGTGDRIKGIMTAFYTAVCTRRVLLIDWPLKEAPDVSPFLAPNKIDWRIPDKIRPMMSHSMPKFNAMDDYDNPYFKQLNVPHGNSLVEIRSNLWSEHKNAVVRVNDTECIQNMWQKEPPRPNPHYTQDKVLFRMGFWTMFKFGNAVHNRKRDMQEKANLLVYSSNPQPQGQRRQLRHSHQEHVSDNGVPQTQTRRRLQKTASFAGQTTVQPYMAVHIRTGIGSGWNDPLRHGSEEDLRKFYQCAKRLQQGIFDRQRQHNCQNNAVYDYQKQLPLLPIFVAADNKIGKQTLAQLDKAASAASGVNSTIRVLENMEIYHIDRSSKQGNHAENTVWGELNVLLESTCLISSRSGFSDMATWLQPTPTGKRCAVMFNQCEDDTKVQQALDALDFSCSNLVHGQA